MTKEMLISEFKTRCIAEIKRVHQTGQPLTITLRGEPLARVVPIFSEERRLVKLGARPGKAIIKRDLVKLDFSGDWEMEQ